ncbi:hypothetical protein G6F32_017342 [Rhizopus arrhizus]|nr:hypothetical protein G6F32_017342 [Rhizopus arrhizus]
MRFTTGRNSVLAASTKIAAITASGSSLMPAHAPTAAEPHRVAAVFRPDTCAPSFMIAPAPRKPTPEIT